MSFATEVKNELCRVPLTRRCCARAESYGVLLYAGSFSPTEVRIVTESEDFAARLPKLFQKAWTVNLLPSADSHTREARTSQPSDRPKHTA